MPKTLDIPDTISLTKVQEFLRSLGIPTADLIELNIGFDGVYVEVYAHDESGGRYFNPDGKSAATHRIAIRLDGTA